MRFVARVRCTVVLLVAAFCVLHTADDARASGEVEIYSTGFEETEGYDDTENLAGQQGWVSTDFPVGTFDGTFANGLVPDVFESSAQQAYIGFDPPSGTNIFLWVWQPIDLDPVPTTTPVIQFKVAFAIIDSTTGEWDNFAFELFNVEGDSLLTLDFDNFSLDIRYALNGDTNFTSTGISFENAAIYDLTITMDFEHNVWRATLNDGETEQFLTGGHRISSGDPLNFGDMSVVWYNAAGFPLNDNYMVFDDYRITAFPKPRVDWLGFDAAGDARVRLFGEIDNTYAIEVGSIAGNWTSVYTNTLSDTFFDYTNANVNVPTVEQRLFRGRLVQ